MLPGVWANASHTSSDVCVHESVSECVCVCICGFRVGSCCFNVRLHPEHVCDILCVTYCVCSECVYQTCFFSWSIFGGPTGSRAVFRHVSGLRSVCVCSYTWVCLVCVCTKLLLLFHLFIVFNNNVSTLNSLSCKHLSLWTRRSLNRRLKETAIISNARLFSVMSLKSVFQSCVFIHGHKQARLFFSKWR